MFSCKGFSKWLRKGKRKLPLFWRQMRTTSNPISSFQCSHHAQPSDPHLSQTASPFLGNPQPMKANE